MEENLRKMMCGNCGMKSFRIYCKHRDLSRLYVECRGCLSITVIGISSPNLELTWGEGAEGILA